MTAESLPFVRVELAPARAGPSAHLEGLIIWDLSVDSPIAPTSMGRERDMRGPVPPLAG
ncbi:MAG: hypothetical protein JF597_19185 [Streptomyces sp.]|uniref:hypothetical protein n=1 Tax=Streptomyces sp. TaxID=1931 RepID=UPI0025EBE8B9|nr:hypothetical protein [Streptomyces sp.]MBW8795632.1 hypothetical protein [Streptomyces sp.]